MMARMEGAPAAHRFYGELAAWWPLISPPEEYTEEAAFLGGLLRSGSPPAREVLELGSGGGHNAFHLKAGFSMTLVDLSGEMLEVSRRLNPECRHRRGDMRTVRLGRCFDAVFVHDAVDYMVSEAELSSAVETAFGTAGPAVWRCSFRTRRPRPSRGPASTEAPTAPTDAPCATWHGRGIPIHGTPGR